ncbi:MAG TPA: AAA family ATPase [Gammaproteobacteria bacterium]|nr:AAA family ATPase [Gammaproteobacteria bacterium]
MYYDYYQLRENPFNVTADPDFFFASKCHAEAISNLVYGIDHRKGILVVSGEVGTGKTTLCRKLLFEAPDNVKFALILNPKFSETQLLQMIVSDLGIVTKQRTRFGLTQVLNEFLITETNKNNNVVLIIDEAQNLTVSQLEQIRLLSNLESEKDKMLQIILVGQPELTDKLRLPELRQVRQRIAVHYNLKPLDKEDINEYIHHRILVAAIIDGIDSHPTFTHDAVDRIFHYTQGSPRTINILCDRALVAGFAAEKRAIDADIIQFCAKEVMYFEHNL